MRVLFWGTPAFAVPALRALGEEGHEIVAVVTQPDKPSGRGLSTGMSAVKEAAISEMIPVLQPANPYGDDFAASVRELEPDLSVVVAYGQILKPQVLALPLLGSVNIHASLLPELRGAAPIHWAVINGHSETGVTIMQMEAGLDSGPMLFQVREEIRADESTSELSVRLAEIGAEAMVEALALMEAGEITATAQDHSRATYAPKLDRYVARLDWTLPAIEVARWIRGLDSVPGAWSELRGEPVKFFAPRVELHSGLPGEVLEAREGVGVLIAAGREAVRVREVQPAGKRRMEADEWIRGRGVKVGDLFA